MEYTKELHFRTRHSHRTSTRYYYIIISSGDRCRGRDRQTDGRWAQTTRANRPIDDIVIIICCTVCDAAAILVQCINVM